MQGSWAPPRAQGMLLAELFKRMACSGCSFRTQEFSNVFPMARTIVWNTEEGETRSEQVQERNVKKKTEKK